MVSSYITSCHWSPDLITSCSRPPGPGGCALLLLLVSVLMKAPVSWLHLRLNEPLTQTDDKSVSPLKSHLEPERSVWSGKPCPSYLSDIRSKLFQPSLLHIWVRLKSDGVINLSLNPVVPVPRCGRWGRLQQMSGYFTGSLVSQEPAPAFLSVLVALSLLIFQPSSCSCLSFVGVD